MLLFINFIPQTECTTLNCAYKNIEFWVVGNLYGCVATVTVDEYRNVTEISGTHESGKTNDEVKGLKIWNQVTVKFPQCITTFFPNIEAIWAESNGINAVSHKDFAPFSKLRQVHFYGNKI